MPGQSISKSGSVRASAVGFTTAALILLSIWAPSAARASGCENTFTNKEGGSWFTAANWSKKALPTSSEEVCITEPGTYSVTQTQTSGTVTVKALTIGAASGKQTLVEGSSSSVNAILTTTAGITIGTNGALTLTNGDGSANSATVVGPVLNAGTITTEVAVGGARTLQGNLTNTGTLQINTNTAFSGEGDALTNEGAIKLAEAKQLTASNKTSITNGAGGSILATGTGDVFMTGVGTKFVEGAGTTSGTLPVFVDDGALEYTGSGASTIAARGTDSLAGNLSAGQKLVIQSTCSENATATAAAGYSNGGAIALTNGDGCANNATLATSSGTLANSGSISVEHEHGGARTLQGNLTNTGTLAFNQSTAYNAAAAALLNEGAITVAEGVQVSVSNSGSVSNGTGGSIVSTGDGDVSMGSGTSFTEAAGTTSGTQPVIVDDAALTYTGAGESLIRLRGTSTLSGTSSTGQSLSIESTCGENASITASPSFANGGAITLTNGDGCGNNATLVGPVSNTGSITSQPEHGGTRNLQGSFTNTGTIQINTNSTFNGSKGLLTNEGAIDVAEGKQLAVSNSSSVTNTTGGSINGTGSGNVFLTGGTLTQGAGTTSGTLPVFVDDGTLDYSGSGASTIALRGTDSLLGNLVAGQNLMIQSTCGENAVVTASAPYNNGGAITLTNGDGCANNETLATSGATLTNSGSITTEPAVGGARTLQGNLTNTGTLQINRNTSYNTATTLLNNGAINIASGVALSVTGGATVTNEAGTIAGTGNGALTQVEGTFNQGAGTTSGTLPVILDRVALHYTGVGVGPIALRGASTLSGNLSAGQVLSIQSTCSENAVVTAAAGIGNSGTIALTNGDGCGNNDTLALPSKAALTNKKTGTIAAERPIGGNRTIEAIVKNEGLLSLSAGQALKLTGTFTQTGLGTFQTAISGSSTFGSLAVTSTAKLAGALVVIENAPFVGKAGETFAVLSSSARSGTFSDLDGVITSTPGRYYSPTYTATGVTLVDTQATLTATPTEGAAGSKVTLKGAGFFAKDKVKLTFTDAKKTKTTFATATASETGELSEEVTLSSKAHAGLGTFTATSGTVTGLVVTTPFTVN